MPPTEPAPQPLPSATYDPEQQVLCTEGDTSNVAAACQNHASPLSADDVNAALHATEEHEELVISKDLLRSDADFRRRAKAGEVDVCEDSGDDT